MESHHSFDVEKLIETIYQKRAIWDKKCGAHGNRYMVDNCWKDVCLEMGHDDETILRKKWKYLRDKLAVEYSKVHNAKNSGFTQSKWHFYPKLLFLESVITPRAYTDNNYKLNPTRQIVPSSNGGGDDREPDFSTAFSQECQEGDQEGDQDTSQDTVDSSFQISNDQDCVIKVEGGDWLVEENHEPDTSNNTTMTHSEAATHPKVTSSPETHPPTHAMLWHKTHQPTPAVPWHETHPPTPAVPSLEAHPSTPAVPWHETHPPTPAMPSHEAHPSTPTILSQEIHTPRMPTTVLRSTLKRKLSPDDHYRHFNRNIDNDSMADNNTNKDKSRGMNCHRENNKDKKIDRSKYSEIEDQDLMFFKTLIPHVRLIPPHIKLKFQSQIQAVVQEFAYNVDNKAGYESKTSSSTSIPSTIVINQNQSLVSSHHDQGCDRINVEPSCPSRSPSSPQTPLV